MSSSLSAATAAVESMVGGGNYARYASSQKTLIDNLCQRFLTEDKVERMIGELPSGEVFRVADFGAADCKNSADIYRMVMRKCGSRRLHLSVHDLPGNDWETARLTCYQLGLRETSSAQYQVTFIPGSFYSPALPPNSVHLSICCMANHWLSKEVLQTNNLSLERAFAIHCKEFTSEEEVASFRDASNKDGVNFLLSRAQELVENQGNLILGNSTRIMENGTEHFTYKAVFEDLSRLMEKWGKTSQGFTLPCYLRSEQEWLELFANPEVKESGLVLKISELEILENPYWERVFLDQEGGQEQEKTKERREQFAREYLKSIWAWAEGTFSRVFGPEGSGRGKEELEEFLKEFEQGLAENPDRYRRDFSVGYMVIEKI